jgi:hypothetical protein
MIKAHMVTLPNNPEVTAEYSSDDIYRVLKVIVDRLAQQNTSINGIPLPAPPPTPTTPPEEPLVERVRASKLDYKRVNQT